MKKSRRILFILFLGVNVLLGIVFAPFVMTILTSLAMAFWLFLRLTFLNIDQKYYWILLTFAGVILTLYRLGQILYNVEEEEPAEPIEPNLMLGDINDWIIKIRLLETSEIEQCVTQQELADLLVSLFRSRISDTTPYEILTALKQRQIPLPEHIYQFVFTDRTTAANGPRLQRALRLIQNTPRKWVRRWTGREKAGICQSIEDIISFMENSLEIKNDEYTDFINH